MGVVLASVFATAVLTTLWAIWPARPVPAARWERPSRRPGDALEHCTSSAERPSGASERPGTGRHRAGSRPDGQGGVADGVRRMARWIRRVVWRTRGPDGRVGHGLGSLVSPGRLEKALLRGAIELTPAEFCLLSLVTAAVGTVAGLLFERPALVLSCAAAGGAIPSLWLRRRVARRIASFERQLPDALTMIAGALRVGQSFLQAADTVSREVPAPLGPELSRLVQETRVNVPLEDALRRLSARVGSLDLDLVVAAVSVQREAGGNLAQVIDRVGETIRDRLRLRGEVRTLTAQGRLSGIIVGSLPLVLGALIWWLSPEYLEILVTSGLGQLMLGAAALLAVIGFFVIRKLVSVDM